MINLELPKKLVVAKTMAHQVAESVFRPIARKYDKIEHCPTPPELVQLGQMLKNMPAASNKSAGSDEGVKNGTNLTGVVSTEEMSWGCIGLMLSIPGQGLGNAAISAVGTDAQKAKFGKMYCAMAITEPGCGSDSAAIRTTARLDGEEWIINGEKIFATAGERGDAVVVWATLDKSLGKAAIKSFVAGFGYRSDNL
jgi:acyl-CoA dehydrogenase